MPLSLFNAWQEIAARSPESLAITDAPSGRSLTFSQLDSAAQDPDQFPTGNGVQFVLQTLAAWRSGLPTCPLEEDHGSRPDLLALPDNIAHVKTTSGSTGAPRYVIFTSEQLAADATNIVATMGLGPAQPNVAVISMAHSYGFSNLVLPLLLHGIPLILGGDPLPNSLSRALTFLPETGGTLPAVPAMWRAWLDAGCLDRERIRTAISAGAPLNPKLELAIYERTGIKVHNFYGSSECGGIAYDRSTSPREKPDVVGSAMRGVSVTIADDGRLRVEGAAVGSGYWPVSEPEILSGQQFHTQDLATIDADGTIHLTGRAGDLINIAGRKLAPSTIEAEILRDPAVDECIVFGVPSPDPERVQEIVAITSGGVPSALSAQIAQHLPAWQRVRHWWVNPDLTPNARGKFSRNEWREKWLEHKR